MYFYADDPVASVSVIVHRGKSSDAAQAEYIETFLAFNRRGVEQGRAIGIPVFILVADPDGEPPNAQWRQRIADASRTIAPRTLCAFLSESAIQRGIVTAINWIRPPPYMFMVGKNIGEAADWAESHRPSVRPVIHRLFGQARLEADRSGAHRPRV